MGTGHYGVAAAQTAPGSTVVAVGDGAVGLCAGLSAAKLVGAERIIVVGHNDKRLDIAKHLGATHTFKSSEPNAQEELVELTRSGAPHVVEAVGNQESIDLAIRVARPGGTVSFVGVPHFKSLPVETIFITICHCAVAPHQCAPIFQSSSRPSTPAASTQRRFSILRYRSTGWRKDTQR